MRCDDGRERDVVEGSARFPVPQRVGHGFARSEAVAHPLLIGRSRLGLTYEDAGRCARMNERICRTASGIRSFGSFHGKMLTSALGASIAASMATA